MVTQAAKKPATESRKTSPKPTAQPPAAPAKPGKKSATKIKVIRDSFTMPQDDYALIATLKEKALAGGIQAKKSALLRAGLQLLNKSSTLQLKRILTGLTPIKTGRPKKP